MRKTNRSNSKKTKRVSFEDKLAQLVGEYRQEQEILEALEEGSTEYNAQKSKCDKLSANVKRFVERQK
ncbi:hypothetical protein AAEU28_15795 [Pseudoalteromonas sp. SS15]|jgi:hypothetical protein|uniref:Uncharacterized protein n=1 Tax=Pseudoalteromonas phenolica TaxID=161398 RepID=A0A0S2K615_9GAMM|nr:hypothetical protein [Pseudoalteromonas phenolica]ALO43771.1 hypothetical protein PP2015_3295 [Pseudoalteromonas phenolica]MBE0355054.1 hypothetical protein [Pseudoalteromonas phenolica O-BC30]TLX45971.1 hypothetical protein C1E24_15750 [Pseudoalteromonas phenolica]